MRNLKKYLTVGATALMLSAVSVAFSSEAMAQRGGHGGGFHGGGGFRGGFGGRGFRSGGFGRGYGFRGGYGRGWGYPGYGWCTPWRAARGWCGGYYGGYYGYPY
jgi:hypothetical protein